MPSTPEDYVWKVLSSQVVLRAARYDVTHEKLLTPDKTVRDYFVVRPRHRAAGVIAVDESGRILLVQQWRHPIQKLVWSIPAGGIEQDEQGEVAANRELREETGHVAGRMEPYFSYHPNPGMADQTFFVFMAHSLRRAGEHDAGEIHAVEWFTPQQIDQMILDNELLDGMSLTALLRWRLDAGRP